MDTKEILINRLKKHTGKQFEILFINNDFSTYTDIDKGDVYIENEIEALGEDAQYFDKNEIHIVEREQGEGCAFNPEGIIEVKDNTSEPADEENSWIDSFDIIYAAGTIISIDVHEAYEEDKNDKLKDYAAEPFDVNEYIKELLLREYFPEDNQTVIDVMVALKRLEGKDVFIENPGGYTHFRVTLERMIFEEIIGEALSTDGIELRDYENDNCIYIDPEMVESFKNLDTGEHELVFEDGSFLRIEEMKR